MFLFLHRRLQENKRIDIVDLILLDIQFFPVIVFDSMEVSTPNEKGRHIG